MGTGVTSTVEDGGQTAEGTRFLVGLVSTGTTAFALAASDETGIGAASVAVVVAVVLTIVVETEELEGAVLQASVVLEAELVVEMVVVAIVVAG